MQVVTILCDWCYAEHERVEADKETTVALDSKPMTADLCADHRKRVEESLAFFMSIARRSDRPAPSPSPSPRTVRQSNKVSPEPNLNGMLPCDLCEREFEKPQGLGRHRLVAHGIKGQSRQPANA